MQHRWFNELSNDGAAAAGGSCSKDASGGGCGGGGSGGDGGSDGGSDGGAPTPLSTLKPKLSRCISEVSV